MRVAALGVDLVPPAQADEAAPGDVFEVVEIGGEEEDGDDEDHDHIIYKDEAEEVNQQACCGRGNCVLAIMVRLWSGTGSCLWPGLESTYKP